MNHWLTCYLPSRLYPMTTHPQDWRLGAALNAGMGYKVAAAIPQRSAHLQQDVSLKKGGKGGKRW